MKKLLAPIAASLILFTVGCKSTGNNPNIGPSLLRFTVGTAAGYELSQRTEAVPAVRIAANVICAAANGTNLSPAQIIADLNTLGPQSDDAVFIIRAAVGAYTLIWNGYVGNTTNVTELQPYLMATCLGLGDALPPTARDRAPAVKSDPKWVAPQVRFKR